MILQCEFNITQLIHKQFISEHITIFCVVYLAYLYFQFSKNTYTHNQKILEQVIIKNALYIL